MSSIRERRLASDNGRERRLLDNLGKLERMLEQEEEQALHTCLLAQVVLVDEPQEQEGRNRLSRKKMGQEEKRRNIRRKQKMEQEEKRRNRQARPQEDEEEEQAEHQEEEDQEEDAIELPNPVCNQIWRTNPASPYVKKVPFPERLQWHPLRGPKQIWIPWPRGIVADNNVHTEHVKCTRLFMKYGTRRKGWSVPAYRHPAMSSIALFGPPHVVNNV